MKIHHATVKKAKKAGIVLSVEDNEIVATNPKTGAMLAMGMSGSEVLERAIVLLNGGLVGEHGTAFKPAIKPKRARRARDEEPEDEDEDEESKDDNSAQDEEAAAEGESEEDEDEQDGGFVKNKYKAEYRARAAERGDKYKATCGDELAKKLSDHTTTKVKVDGKTVTRVDVKKLKRFAKANDVWQPRYDELNPGMARMNVANRLRGLIKKDPEFKITWA